MLSSAPLRSYSMDYVPARQPVPLSNLRPAGFAPLQGAAFLQKLRSGGTMNTAVHTTAAQQAWLRSIYNGIHFQFRDIVTDIYCTI